MDQYTFWEIAVGDVVYHMRNKCEYRISHDNNEYVCCISDHPLNLVGYGNSEENAVKDFEQSLHAEYSKLRSMLGFEMNEEQKSTWNVLNEIIDSEKFEQEILYYFRRLGRIKTNGKRYPVWIENVDGLKEKVPNNVLDYGEFVKLEDGQWIEYVAVCRGGHKINPDSICHFEKTTFKEYSDQEIKEWFESLPVANLPCRDWNWP